MRDLFATSLLVSLAACSTFGGKDSGQVHQIGKDSYTVRTLSERSVSTAKQQALTLAGEACQKQSRSVMLTDENTGTEESTGEKYYDLTFMCLTSGDTDFTRIKRNTGTTLQAPSAQQLTPDQY